MKFSTVIAVSLCLVSSGIADLKFEAEKVELKAEPSDEVLKGVFKFKNEGSSAVEITKVDSGCSCLSGTIGKKIYAAGESGELAFEFKLGSFTGYQEKGLTLRMGDRSKRLMVGVQIPNVITITPDVLEWTVGGKPVTKSFKMVVDHPDPIKVTDVLCRREGFEIALKAVEEGREYEISLTPESTDKAMLGLVTIKTDCEIDKHRVQNAFFAISRPKRSKASGQ